MMYDRCKLMIHLVLEVLEHDFKYISSVPTFCTDAVTWKQSMTVQSIYHCESAFHSEHDIGEYQENKYHLNRKLPSLPVQVPFL